MKRWSALLLLVLLPLTMAPRTSLTPGPVALTIYGNVSRQQVRVNQPVSVMLQVKNSSSQDLVAASLVMDVTLSEGSPRAFDLLGVSPTCLPDREQPPLTITCDLGPMRQGEQRTVHMAMRLRDNGVFMLGAIANGDAGDLGLLSPQPIDKSIEIIVGGRDGR